LRIDGQKGLRRESRKRLIALARNSRFCGSPSLPSEPGITTRDAATHKLLAMDA